MVKCTYCKSLWINEINLNEMKCYNALGEGMTSNEMLFLVGKRKAF